MSDFNMDQLVDLVMFYGIKILMALAIYIIGKGLLVL